MTYMLLLNCALKLVEEIILYCDTRSKKHQILLSHIHNIRNDCYVEYGRFYVAETHLN